jgi:hypothetical protein
MIKLLKGWHITATEKRAIEHLVKSGATHGYNRPKTKVYTVQKGWTENGNTQLIVSIDTRATFTIGRGTETRRETVHLEVIKPKTENTPQQQAKLF